MYIYINLTQAIFSSNELIIENNRNRKNKIKLDLNCDHAHFNM